MMSMLEKLDVCRRLSSGRGFVSAVHLSNAMSHIDAQQARIADLELALFAENQKRQEVERQHGKLQVALDLMLERVPEPPEANCSCHLSPPCNDCIDYGGEREAFELAKDAIAAVRGEAPCTPTSPS